MLIKSAIITLLSCGLMLQGAINPLVNKNENKQELITFEATPLKENVTTYPTSSGDHTIYWAQGITPPKMTEDPKLLGTKGYFDLEVYGTYETYSAEMELNKGYYDYNKNLSVRPYEHAHCYLGAAANIISWWLDQNEVYVNEYIRRLKETDIYANYDGLYKVLPYSEQMWTDITKDPGIELQDNYKSQKLGLSPLVTNYLRPYYNKEEDGYYSDMVFDFFFNGYDAIPTLENMPDPNTPENFKKDPRGGFFFPLLGREVISERTVGGQFNTYDYLNKNFRRIFAEGNGVVIGYERGALEAHAITAWGADYDENGNLCRLYITDSDDYQASQSDDEFWRGLVGFNTVADKNGKLCLTNNTKPNLNKPGNYINNLYLLNLSSELLASKLNDTAAPTKPNIIKEPQDKVLALNANTEFKVEANLSDKGELFYQWYEADDINSKGKALHNQNKPILPYNAKELGTKYYYCEITNVKNGKTNTTKTNHFKVDVQDIPLVNAKAPTISFNYNTVTYDQYQTPKPLKVTATSPDGGELTYQWYRSYDNYANNGTIIKGETSPIYYPPTSEAYNSFYYCVVTNTNYNVTGNPKTSATSQLAKRISIRPSELLDAKNPLITKNPTDLTVEMGETATLEVEARVFDTGVLSYQWYEVNPNTYEEIILENETNKKLNITTSSPSNKLYRCKVINTNEKAKNNKTNYTISDTVNVIVKGDSSLSNDNLLHSLTISNAKLSPSFDPNIFSYSAVLNHDANKLDINTLINPLSNIEINNPTVDYGKTATATIKVIAEDLSYKIYSISVTRSDTHQYGDWITIKEPTCTEKGTKKRVCKICNQIETQEIEALGHNFGEWITDSEATCSTTGTKHRICKTCGTRENGVIPINPSNHVWDTEWTIDKEPTCTEPGLKSHHCIHGDARKDETIIDALGHNFGEWIIETEATCSSTGLKYRICKTCDHREEEVIPVNPLNHVWDTEWTVDKEPTCTETGLKSHHCIHGDARKDETIIDALGHNFGEWIIETEATCSSTGLKYRICKTCGNREEEVIPVNPTNHVWSDEWTVDKEPTCTETGLKSHHCIHGDARKDETVIETLGHNFGEWIVETEATCSTTGLRYRICNTCGTREEEVIPVNPENHVWDKEWIIDKEPTCTEPGLKSHHCIHGDAVKDETVIDALGHNYGEWIVETEATCSTTGLKYRICKTCNHREEEVIPLNSTNHVWSDEWTVDKEPTCTETGLKSHHCIHGDAVKDETVIEALGHSYGEWIVETEPTCSSTGLKYRICGTCGNREEETLPINPSAHKWDDNWTIDKEPTHKEEGLKSHHCLYCNERKDETRIPKLEHDFGEWIIETEATCSSTGLKYRICKDCALREEVIIPINPNNHVWSDEWTVDKEPTCTETGLKSHHCIHGDARKDETVIEALGHDFGEWIIETEATCSTTGLRYRICKTCNHREEEIIPVNPENHVWSDEWTVDKEPTCTETGLKSHHCIHGDARKDETIIDALGHSYGEWIIETEATCSTTGLRYRICNTCGNREEEVIPLNPTNHIWSDEWTVDKEPTCTDPGLKSHHCIHGDAVKDETVIETLGHDYGEWIIETEATCSTTGLRYRICKTCGNREEEIIPVNPENHVWSDEWTIDKEPTCTETGLKSHHCIHGDAKKDETIIDALGHDFGEWEVVVEATTEKEGLERRVCKTCGEVEERVIPKKEIIIPDESDDPSISPDESDTPSEDNENISPEVPEKPDIDDNNDKKSNAGLIAGITIPSVIVVIGLIVFIIFKSKKKII